MKSAPFDRVAADYDRQFTDTPVGRLQRARVHRLLDQLLTTPALDHVLEFSCGTGADARWLAQRGCHVLATDSSQGMIATAREKTAHWSFPSPAPTFRVLPFERLHELELERPVDLVLSNFGGLNCLSPEALREWGQGLAPQIRPGGYLAAVVMGRFCAWETAYFLLKGNWSRAWRRRSKGPVLADLGDGASIATWYYSPREFARHCGAHFSVVAIRPIGLAVPPSYLDPWFRRRPGWLQRLAYWEARWGERAWGAGLADHYWIL